MVKFYRHKYVRNRYLNSVQLHVTQVTIVFIQGGAPSLFVYSFTVYVTAFSISQILQRRMLG